MRIREEPVEKPPDWSLFEASYLNTPKLGDKFFDRLRGYTLRRLKVITVFFEDHGQDFLEWDIKDGVVVDCRPFQGWLWNGTKVHNTDIQPGDILEISLINGGRTTINYPVERVGGKVSV